MRTLIALAFVAYIAVCAPVYGLSVTFDVTVTARATRSNSQDLIFEANYQGDRFLLTGTINPEPSYLIDYADGSGSRIAVAGYEATWDWSPFKAELDAINPFDSYYESTSQADILSVYEQSGFSAYQQMAYNSALAGVEQVGGRVRSFVQQQRIYISGNPGYQSAADVELPQSSAWLPKMNQEAFHFEHYAMHLLEGGGLPTDYAESILYVGSARLVEPAPVPLPGTLPLLCVGIVSLLGTRNRIAQES